MDQDKVALAGGISSNNRTFAISHSPSGRGQEARERARGELAREGHAHAGIDVMLQGFSPKHDYRDAISLRCTWRETAVGWIVDYGAACLPNIEEHLLTLSATPDLSTSVARSRLTSL